MLAYPAPPPPQPRNIAPERPTREPAILGSMKPSPPPLATPKTVEQPWGSHIGSVSMALRQGTGRGTGGGYGRERLAVDRPSSARTRRSMATATVLLFQGGCGG